MDNKKNANNIKYKIDIFRVLGCIVIYGIFGVLSFSYMRSYLALVFITVFAILPVYSVACLIVLSKNVLIEFINREDCIEINQSIGIVIHVTNKSFFSSLRCLCKLNLYNDYYSLEAQQNYNIPVSAKADDVHTLVCTAQYLGKIRVELSEAVLHDFFGIFKAYITCHDEMNVIVMPSFETIDDNTRAGLLEGCIDNTDENIKGTDYSDTKKHIILLAGSCNKKS